MDYLSKLIRCVASSGPQRSTAPHYGLTIPAIHPKDLNRSPRRLAESYNSGLLLDGLVVVSHKKDLVIVVVGMSPNSRFDLFV